MSKKKKITIKAPNTLDPTKETPGQRKDRVSYENGRFRPKIQQDKKSKEENNRRKSNQTLSEIKKAIDLHKSID